MTNRLEVRAARVAGPLSGSRRRFLLAAGAPLLLGGVAALPPMALAANDRRKRVETPGKTWLEVSLNGPCSRDRQPGIPIPVKDIVAEGIVCARAGAAIVHVHAYDVAVIRSVGKEPASIKEIRRALARV